MGQLLQPRMPTIQRSDPNGEGNIEQIFTRLKFEIFNRNTTEREAARLDLDSGGGECLPHGLGGSIDGEDVSVTHFPDHGSRRRAGPAADLQDAHAAP